MTENYNDEQDYAGHTNRAKDLAIGFLVVGAFVAISFLMFC